MPKKYVVQLTAKERQTCEDSVRQLSGASLKARRARILLHADEDGPDHWTDREIAQACRCREVTVENVRRRFVLEGFDRALAGKQRATPPVPKPVDGQQEAAVIASRLGEPAAGAANWSLRLLPGGVVALEIGDSTRHATVARTSRKRAARMEDPDPGDSAGQR